MFYLPKMLMSSNVTPAGADLLPSVPFSPSNKVATTEKEGALLDATASNVAILNIFLYCPFKGYYLSTSLEKKAVFSIQVCLLPYPYVPCPLPCDHTVTHSAEQ